MPQQKPYRKSTQTNPPSPSPSPPASPQRPGPDSTHLTNPAAPKPQPKANRKPAAPPAAIRAPAARAPPHPKAAGYTASQEASPASSFRGARLLFSRVGGGGAAGAVQVWSGSDWTGCRKGKVVSRWTGVASAFWGSSHFWGLAMGLVAGGLLVDCFLLFLRRARGDSEDGMCGICVAEGVVMPCSLSALRCGQGRQRRDVGSVP